MARRRRIDNQNPENRLSANPILLPLLLAGLLAGGVILTAWSFHESDRALRERLGSRLRRIAETLHADELRLLSGTPVDLESPTYQSLRHQLDLIRQSEPDCAFLYLVGHREDGRLFFYLGSADQAAPDQVQPGDLYPSADLMEDRTFQALEPSIQRIRNGARGDRFSATHPIRDSASGPVLALAGLEIPAGAWRREQWRIARPAFVMSAASGVLLLLFLALLAWRRRLAGLAPGWMIGLEPAGVLLAGILATIYSAYGAYLREFTEVTDRFEQLADSVTGQTAQSLQHLRDRDLKVITSFFASSKAVTQEEFSQFVTGWQHDPAIEAWLWIPLVRHDDREAFEAELRGLGMEGAGIWEQKGGRRRGPAPVRDSYYPLRYVAPLPGHEAALGFDYLSEPLRKKALMDALESRMAKATTLTKTMDLVGPRSSMIIFHRLTGPKDDLIACVLKLDRLLPRNEPKAPVHCTLELVYPGGGQPWAEPFGSPHPYDHRLATQRPINAFGQVFRVNAYAGAGFDAKGPARSARFTLLYGLSLSFAAALIYGVPVLRRRELERLVAERTEALRARESQYRDLAEDMRDVVWILDTETFRYTYVSPSVYRLLDRTPEEIMAGTVDDTLADAASRKAIRHQLAEQALALRAGQIGTDAYFVQEAEQVRKDGTRIWTEVVMHYRIHPHSGRIEAHGVTRDITERRSTEQALRDNRRFLSDLVENSGTIIYVKNADGVYELVNRRWEEITGIPRERALGHTDAQLFPAADAAAFRAHDEEVMAAGLPLEREETLNHGPARKRFFISIKFPLRTDEGAVRGVCGMTTEITELKQADLRMRGQMEELQQWHALTLGRENRVMELKREVNQLLQQLGRPPAYENT